MRLLYCNGQFLHYSQSCTCNARNFDSGKINFRNLSRSRGIRRGVYAWSKIGILNRYYEHCLYILRKIFIGALRHAVVEFIQRNFSRTFSNTRLPRQHEMQIRRRIFLLKKKMEMIRSKDRTLCNRAVWLLRAVHGERLNVKGL